MSVETLSYFIVRSPELFAGEAQTGRCVVVEDLEEDDVKLSRQCYQRGDHVGLILYSCQLCKAGDIASATAYQLFW